MRLRQRSAGVPAGRSRSRSRTPDQYTCLAPRCRIDTCQSLVQVTQTVATLVTAMTWHRRRIQRRSTPERASPSARSGLRATRRQGSSTVPTPELNGRRERCVISVLLGFRLRSTPWQASPLGRPRIRWGAEGLIIEQDAAEAVGLPGQSLVTASKRMTMRSDEVWLASAR
jgi:hypothetical protein